MEIDINEYLDEEDKKQIAEDVFRKYVSDQLRHEADLQRFLSNTAYHVVYAQCDKTLDVDMKQLLKDNVAKVVAGLSHYSVFRKPNAWDSETNEMYTFLSKCLEEQKPEVKRLVEEAVPKAVLEQVEDNIQEMIIEAVQNIYKGVKE